ncbi:MAG: hypothetical protein ACOYI5_10970, partial [Christensenellales bacterium]
LADAKIELHERAVELEQALNDIEGITGSLADAQAKATVLEGELEAAQINLAAREGELSAAQAEIASLTGGLDAAQGEVATLEGALADAGAREEALNTALSNTETELAETKAALAKTQGELADTKTELSKTRAELEAYRMRYVVGMGESHASAGVNGSVRIAADGVSGTYELENKMLSGNAIVFELALGEEIIHTSARIEPGEKLEAFTLTEPLAAGVYEGTVAIRTLNQSGVEASVMRIPVEIVVGE